MRSGPVLCLGAAHWDVIGRAPAALAPGGDAPGAVERRPGGVALNVALALARRGVPVSLMTAVGRDAEGDALLALAAARGVDCAGVLRRPSPTDAYVAIEAAGELFAAVADCRTLEAAGLSLAAALAGAGPWTAVVVDGNMPSDALAALAAAPALAGGRLHAAPASPAKADRMRALLVATRAEVCANRAEAEALCGGRLDGAAAAARALVALGAARALVTDGPGPAALAGPGGAIAIAQPSHVSGAGPRSVTGAGDALLAGLIAAERAGATEPAALLAAALDAAAAHISEAG